MAKYLKILCLLVLVSFCALLGKAQQAVVPGGGEASGTGGSVSFTIGQVDYISSTSGNTTVSQGVQQAFEIFIISGARDFIKPVNFSLYPNPCTDFLTLQADDNSGKYSYSLWDVTGRQFSQSSITAAYTPIPLTGLVSGVYFVTIYNETTAINTYKIIKH